MLLYWNICFGPTGKSCTSLFVVRCSQPRNCAMGHEDFTRNDAGDGRCGRAILAAHNLDAYRAVPRTAGWEARELTTSHTRSLDSGLCSWRVFMVPQDEIERNCTCFLGILLRHAGLY